MARPSPPQQRRDDGGAIGAWGSAAIERAVNGGYDVDLRKADRERARGPRPVALQQPR